MLVYIWIGVCCKFSIEQILYLAAIRISNLFKLFSNQYFAFAKLILAMIMLFVQGFLCRIYWLY